MSYKDIEVFVIWENATLYRDQIIERISDRFQVLKQLEIEWTPERFSENLTAFYEMDLRNDCDNIRVRGTGKFLAIVACDPNPVYSLQRTSRGVELVNTNTFALKNAVRRDITHTYSFHASVNEGEARNHIVKLTGLNLADFLAYYAQDGETVRLRRDCPGVSGWSSAKELFYVLNECMPYVVLRGFQNMPDHYTFANDGDIDLLVEDMPRFRNLLMPRCDGRWNAYEFFNYVDMGGERVLVHPKFVGDGYYDKAWQKRILETRKFANGIYIPDDEMLFYTLLHHGIFHKSNYMKYEEQLRELSEKLGIKYCSELEYLRKLLASWMRENGYKVRLHLDHTAGHLVRENIDDDLLDESGEYYLFKAYSFDRFTGAQIISREMIRENPTLFTRLVSTAGERYFVLDRHRIDEASPLYAEVSKREKATGEYLWRISKRYHELSLMTASGREEKTVFRKSFLFGATSVGDEIRYVPERSEYIQSGVYADDYLAAAFRTGGETGLMDAVVRFLDALFAAYGEDEKTLKPAAWDLYSKNCVAAEGDRFLFFDHEATAREHVEKASMIAVQVDWLLKTGIFSGGGVTQSPFLNGSVKEPMFLPQRAVPNISRSLSGSAGRSCWVI